jgi:hypothetical protein
MAWSFDGMTKAQFDADVTANTNMPRVLSSTPWLIKKIRVVVDSSTAAEVLHGESVMPDILCSTFVTDEPDASNTLSLYKGSTNSYVAIDSGRNGAGTFDVLLIWFNVASGGISA